jgi:hypothetical protein
MVKILLCSLYVVSAVLFSLSTPAFAQDTEALSRPGQQEHTAKVQEFQRIIEAQERQLDTQQEQLETQKKKLEELRQQVQSLAVDSGRPGAPSAEKPAATPAGPAPSRRTDSQTARRDKDHPHEDWQGSFGVEAIDTRFKIGGFAELDVIHDSDAIASKGQFVTSTIVTRDATKTDGSDGQTNFSVSPSRLYFETRTPLGQRQLTTFVSMDFFGDGLGVTPEPRLRQGYGEITNILFGGDLLAGQAWTTFADLEAFPNTLDFQGPNSFFGTRQPLIRWTKGVADGLKLMVAAETPDNHIIQGADALTRWPDGVFSMSWDHAAIHLKGSVIARDLRASFNNGPTQTAFGWGGSISGRWRVPVSAKRDSLTFSATYGEGIGSDFNDQPPDAVFDSTGSSLETIPVFGWFASYEHWWSHQFNSTFVFGDLKVNNQPAQPVESLAKTRYASGNFVWVPNEHWLLGVEALWGMREDKDGADGTDFRTQFTSRFIF